MIEAMDMPFHKTNPERVVALSYGSRKHLEALGLWQDIVASGAGTIRHIEVREPDNHGLSQLHADEADVDALGYVVEIADVVRPIYAALEGKVTWFRPAQLQSYTQYKHKVELCVSHDGKTTVINAALLVGADGTNSQVRRMAGIGMHGWDHNRFGLVASIQCERGHEDTAYECFRTSGPLAFLPLSDGRFSIVWALAPQEAVRMMDLPEKMFLKRLQRAVDEAVLPRSGKFMAMGKRACFPLEWRIAKAYTETRVALVGNAAHTVHPVAGQGMNLGLRDVNDLVGALSSELAKADAGEAIVLTSYAEQRRLDVLAVSAFTESMLASFGNDFMPLKWLRGQALAALESIPPLRDALIQHAAGLSQVGGSK
jgi:ubiquinone biosynthesis UbiH/UbiF/VisC/COQ6 family hydroxylase